MYSKMYGVMDVVVFRIWTLFFEPDDMVNL